MTVLDTPARWCLLVWLALFWATAMGFIALMAVVGFALFGVWGICGAVFTVLSGVCAFAWWSKD